MKSNPLPKAMVAAVLAVVPFALAIPGHSLAKHDGACVVGDAAYPTIQSAVNDAACALIDVPKGTFYENITGICRNVVIRGAGARKTVVDGSRQPLSVFSGCALWPGTGHNEVTLTGMTITGGNAFTPPYQNGGGFQGADVLLTVDDCHVTNNVAGNRGGGLSVIRGTITIHNSTIENNRAVDGGGVRMEGSGVSSTLGASLLTITNSVISGNTATRWGGGIVVAGGSVQNAAGPPAGVVMRKSSVDGNAAAAGGGIYIDNATLTVDNADIVGNTPNDLTTRFFTP